MATPIRKKRNFKGLGLDVAQPTPTAEPEPIPTRLAPTAGGGTGGKRRPPPLKSTKPAQAPAPEPDSEIVVTVANNGPSSAPATGSVSARRMTYHTNLANTLANLDMNAEVKFDLRNEDLKDLQELGQGNGGSVKKVEHTPTNTIMAKKVCYFRRSLMTLQSGTDLRGDHARTTIDCPDRCQTFSAKTNPSRTPNYARL
jgi:mitogen-activated protein kinase kinase